MLVRLARRERALSGPAQKKEEDHVESELLALLKQEQTKTFYSLDDLAQKIGVSPLTIYEKLTSLEAKGYVRFARVVELDAEPSANLASDIENGARSILLYLRQLKALQSKENEVTHNVYDKIGREIIGKIATSTSQFANARTKLERQLEELESKIRETEEKIQEIKVRGDIGEIIAKDAEKMIESLQQEIQALKLSRKEFRQALGIEQEPSPPRKTDNVTNPRLEQIRLELEELWARHQVGELDQKDYDARKAELDAEKRKCEEKTGLAEGIQELTDEILSSVQELETRLHLEDADKTFSEIRSLLTACRSQ